MRRAQSVTSAPAGVRREPCGERSSTVTPSIRSMERMRSLAVSWLTPVSRAARPRLPSRATARSSSSAPSSGTRCASPGLRRSPGRCCSPCLRRSPCLRCSSVPIRPPYALIGVYSLVGARGRDECGGHDRIPAGRPRHPTAGRPFHGGALHRDSFRRDFHRGSLPGGCLPGRSVPGGVPAAPPAPAGLRALGPNWYAAVMGTAIIASAGEALPSSCRARRWWRCGCWPPRCWWRCWWRAPGTGRATATRRAATCWTRRSRRSTAVCRWRCSPSAAERSPCRCPEPSGWTWRCGRRARPWGCWRPWPCRI